MSVIQTILREWAKRVDDGQPNPTNPKHIRKLVETLRMYDNSESFIHEFVQNIMEIDPNKEDDEKKARDAKSKEVEKEREDNAKEAGDRVDKAKAEKEKDKADKESEEGDSEPDAESQDVGTNLWANDPQGGLTDGEYEELHGDEEIEESINEGKLTEEEDEFLATSSAVLKTDAKHSEDIIGEYKKAYNSLSTKERKYLQDNFRKLSIDKFVSGYSTIIGKLGKFFTVKKGGSQSAAGIGNGEVLISLMVKNSVSGGTGLKDILIGSKVFEVKEPDSSGWKIRIGKDGNTNNSPTIVEIQNLIAIVNRFDHSTSQTELSKLSLEYIDSDITTRFKAAGELPPKYFTKIYEFVTKAKAIISATEVGNDTTITVAGDDTYYIDQKDADKIQANKTVSVEIHNNVADDFTEQYISLLNRHSYIKDPELVPKDMHEVVKYFFKSLNGLIFFSKSGKKVDLYTSSKNFVADSITQGKWKLGVYLKSHKEDVINKQIQ
jgi:hypothetical protein